MDFATQTPEQIARNIVDYANKRFNAGVMYNCIVVTKDSKGSDTTGFVGLTYRQEKSIQKSIRYIMSKPGYTVSAPQKTAVMDSAVVSAIDSKYAELSTMPSTLQ